MCGSGNRGKFPCGAYAGKAVRAWEKVYHSPELSQIRAFCEKEVDRLWTEVKRFENPHHYYVDLSPRLWNEKNRLLSEHSF